MLREPFQANRWRADTLAVAVLIVFVVLRFLPVLLRGQLYAPFGDNTFIYGPMFAETARIALHSQFPFYLPSFATGFPLYQSAHYSPAYPFYFFGWLDYGGPLRSLYVLTYLSMFHRAVLAINFFVMLRAARVSALGALLGAALGIFAYNTEVYAGWITIAAAYTWLPLAIAGAILLIRQPRSLTGILLLGGGVGMLSLASASQVVAHALLFFVVFFAGGFIWSWREHGRRESFRLLVSLVLAGVLAVSLGGISAIPVYLGIPEMIRHISRGFVIGHEHIPWEVFTATRLAPGDWVHILFNPGAVEVLGSPYVGPVGVAGIIGALFFYPRLDSLSRWLVVTFGVIGLYGLLSAFGAQYGLAYLNFHLPMINKIREAGRHLSLFLIATVLLTGIGFDQLEGYVRKIKDRQRWFPGAIFPALLLIGLSIAIIVQAVAWRHPLPYHYFVLFLAPLTVGLGFLMRCQPWSYGLIALIISVAAMICPPRTFSVSISDFAKPQNLKSHQVLEEVRRRVKPGDYRIDFVDPKFDPGKWTMNASYYGFDGFYNQLTPQPYEQFQIGWSLRRAPVRELMGERYVLCAKDSKPLDGLAFPRFGIDGYTLFENPVYMDRITLVHSSAGTYTDKTDLLAAIDQGFDFQHRVYLRKDDAAKLDSILPSELPAEEKIAKEKTAIRYESTNHISVEIRTALPGLVVLNQWFTPAWKARVNGKSAPIFRANWWQVGVPVAPGKSIVEFSYRPTLASILLILNRVTWVVILCLVGAICWKRRFSTIPLQNDMGSGAAHSGE